MPRKAGLFGLIAILYFTVSGGPFGLEPAVSSVGPAMAVLLIALVPLVWGLPTALMVAELSAALPGEGGFYLWVTRALGPFWGFQEAWWSWICELPDMAIYPVLFTSYAAEWLHLNTPQKWMMSLAVIWISTALNLAGIGAVGATAILSGVFVVAPFLLFSFLGMSLPGAPIVWHVTHGGFLLGLSIVLFNYTGWDNISLVGDEVENPQRNYPIALLGGLALITAMYLLPVLAGLHIASDPSAWHEGVFPILAKSLPGGPWLSVWLLAGALISAFVQFNSLMLSNSRLPMVLARDGYFPKFLERKNSRDVPTASVIVCAIGYSVFALLGYDRLVVLYVVVYTFSIVLEFLALWILRVREPELPRPFRVPGGAIGLALTVIVPLVVGLVVWGFTIQQGIHEPRWLVLAAAATLSGIPVWLLVAKRHRGV
jgi:amino acid transporter